MKIKRDSPIKWMAIKSGPRIKWSRRGCTRNGGIFSLLSAWFPTKSLTNWVHFYFWIIRKQQPKTAAAKWKVCMSFSSWQWCDGGRVLLSGAPGGPTLIQIHTHSHIPPTLCNFWFFGQSINELKYWKQMTNSFFAKICKYFLEITLFHFQKIMILRVDEF